MIKFIVTAIAYTRYVEPYKDYLKVYEGESELKLLKQIAQTHGYPPCKEHTLVSQVLAKIAQENGDGCDCILSIIDGNGNIIFDGTID
jgi:hypothetical protein